jgi:hypothetical protein
MLLCALRLAALLFWGGAAFSQDFGLALRSLPALGSGEEAYGDFEYAAAAVPWFAAPLGEQGDLYLSGGMSLVYADEAWRPVPELYRFEAAFRFGSDLRIALGRVPSRDPLNLGMNGLFDGLSLEAGLGKARLSAGAFYTGFLYKRTAHITMSVEDYAAYHDWDRYFAPRRLVFALGGEISSLFNTQGKLNLGLIGQFDLNELDDTIVENERIHSQYALAGFTAPLGDRGHAALGFAAELVEEGGSDPEFCFAASAELAWLPPKGPEDRLSLAAALSSGVREGLRAFLPINTIAQGKVLRPGLSGLALVEAEYTALLHRTLSAELSAAYFFRTDTQTYRDSGLDMTSLSPLLGGEVYGGFAWGPVSDIAFSLGGGVFFPQWGRAFAEDAPHTWRVSLETILSF